MRPVISVKCHLYYVTYVQKLPSTSILWKFVFFGQVLLIMSAFFSFPSM